jgi:hypothetical protein
MYTITVVRYQPKHSFYADLEGDLLYKGMLPSIAFGRRGCSAKYKKQPQEAFLREWPLAKAAWRQGFYIEHVIGYDAGPKDARRGNHISTALPEFFSYPLRDWGWDRERCIAEIRRDKRLARIAAAHGIDPCPPKSACFFCPVMRKEELDDLRVSEPDKIPRILEIERRAAPGLRTKGGLWGRATKSRPASMTEYLTGKPLKTGAAADPVIIPKSAAA